MSDFNEAMGKWRDSIVRLTMAKAEESGAYGNVVRARDALLSPPPAASTPVAYVPKVGDVVKFGSSPSVERWLVVEIGDDSQGHPVKCRFVTTGSLSGEVSAKASQLEYVRPTTPAERLAAGLDKPAPVASEARATLHGTCEVCETVRNVRGFCKCDESWDNARPTPAATTAALPVSVADVVAQIRATAKALPMGATASEFTSMSDGSISAYNLLNYAADKCEEVARVLSTPERPAPLAARKETA